MEHEPHEVRRSSSRARLSGWLLIAIIVLAVLLGAGETGVVVVVTVLGWPVQFFVCRAILKERGYPQWFTWFSLLFGPVVGTIIALGLPEIPGQGGTGPS